MARLVVTERADDDLASIIQNLRDTAGEAVALRYRQAIDQVFERLVRFPRSGMSRRKMGRHVRIAVVAPYIIFYENQRDDVVIVRILDGRRNITRRLVRE
jgi:plasmid stabilization system protein ParE